MGFIYEDNQTAYPTKPPALGGEDTGFLENLNASAKLFDITNLSTSRKREMKSAWQPIVDNINKKTNAGLKNPYETEVEMDVVNPRLWNKPYTAELWDYNAINKKQSEIINFAKNNKDLFPEYMDLSVQTLYKQVADKQKQAEAEQADVAARQTGLGAVGEFSGYAWSAIKDPINLGVTGIDFAVGGGKYKLGASVASNVLRLALRDAAINAGSEAIIQTEVADWYKDLKLPYDINTFLTNVGAAGVGGFVLRGGLESVAPLYQLTKKQLASGIEAINKAKAKATGTPYEVDESLKAFTDASEIDDFTDARNIIPDDVGNLEHNTIIDETIKNIEEGNSVKALTGQDITDTPVINEVADTDLNLFDGADSVGHTQQTDILLAELNDNVQTRGDEFLNQTVPVDKFDPNTGETVQSAMTVKEMLEEAEQDKKMVDRLMGCLT
jgi:hypothetical protein